MPGSRSSSSPREWPRLLSYAEASAYVSLSEWQLRKLARNGELTKIKYGHRSVRFERSELDKLVAAHRMRPESEG